MQRKLASLIFLSLFFGTILMPVISTEIQAQETELPNVLFPSSFELQAFTFDPSPVLVEFKKQEPGKISFEIPIPGDRWKRFSKEELADSENILAGFTHPDGPDHGMIQVLEYFPSYEVNPKDWLLWKLEQMNMRAVTSAGDGQEGSGRFFEALAVSKLPEGSSQDPLMMRAGVFRSGKSFVLILCMAPSEPYLDLSFYFGLAIHRFELQDKKPPELIGQWDQYCIGSYCYTGPVPGPTSAESSYKEMDQKFYPLALANERTGFINIRAFQSPLSEKTSAKQRINNIVYNMIENNMSLDEDLLAFKSEHQNLGGTAYYTRNKGLGVDNSRINFFAFSWEGDREAVLLYMITDAKEESPVAWMVNKRIFEIISQSLFRKVQSQ